MVCNTHYYWVSGLCPEFRTMGKVQKPSSNEDPFYCCYPPICLGLSNSHFTSGFPTKTLHTFLFSPSCVTCPVHLILLDLIMLIIFGEKYKLWSWTLRSLLRPLNVSPLFIPNILLSKLFSIQSVSDLPLMCKTKFHAHTKPQEKL
jgi:hypothetical protein